MNFLNSYSIPLIFPEIIGQNQFTNILLIDSQVNNYQQFVDSVNSNTYPIVYSISSSKTELLTLLQTNFTNISRIGIVFISNLENTKTFLDFNPLFSINEIETEPYSENVQFMINIINEFQVKNIDYLACNTLNYSNWVNYYRLLTQNTGVIVGASNNKTGNIKYGGDWIMENTSQTIENIYFTKNIEYYTYLLDYSYWATSTQGLVSPFGIAVDPTNAWLYVGNYGNDTISRISLYDPSIYTQNWATNTQGVSNPFGIAVDPTNTWLYASSYGNNTISKILVANPSTYTKNWATNTQGLVNPQAIVIDSTNTWMYVGNYGNNTISKILVANPNVFTQNWATNTQGLTYPTSIAIDSTNTWMYVGNYGNNTISRILLSDPSIYTQNWVPSTTGLYQPQAIVIDSTNTWIYVANSSNFISKILVANPNVFTLNWATTAQGLMFPRGIAINSNSLYVTNFSNSTISKILLPITCFKEGSKILTSQGYKLIQDLKKGDLVKTLNDYKAIDMIGKRNIQHNALEERIKDQLYVCSTEKYEVWEDLVLTGCHSLLVDDFKDQEREKSIEVNGGIYITENKYRLPVCVDERANVYEIPGTYTIYHLALENDDYYMNYGIYANGLLVESCSKRYLKELSNMELIE